MSYSFVMSQYRKIRKYTERIADIKHSRETLLPKRPDTSIFSEIFYSEHKVKSPYLVLGEVNAANAESLAFAAIMELRKLADICVMLSGGPIDNTWLDIFAILQWGS